MTTSADHFDYLDDDAQEWAFDDDTQWEENPDDE